MSLFNLWLLINSVAFCRIRRKINNTWQVSLQKSLTPTFKSELWLWQDKERAELFLRENVLTESSVKLTFWQFQLTTISSNTPLFNVEFILLCERGTGTKLQVETSENGCRIVLRRFRTKYEENLLVKLNIHVTTNLQDKLFYNKFLISVNILPNILIFSMLRALSKYVDQFILAWEEFRRVEVSPLTKTTVVRRKQNVLLIKCKPMY